MKRIGNTEIADALAEKGVGFQKMAAFRSNSIGQWSMNGN
jgi:hypothetical protein